MRKRDLLLALALLLAAAAAWGVAALVRAGRTATGRVLIYVDGAVYADVSLSESRTLEIEQENGDRNVVRIDRGAVRMESSTCRNQLCLRQGEVTAENFAARSMGTRIVCLPNRVVVELETGQPPPDDAPDI